MPAWVAYGRAAAAPRLLRWRCRRLAAACPVRLVGDIRHATAVFHKVFGQENKPGAPVTSSQGARDTNVRPPNRAWEERSRPAKLAAAEPPPEIIVAHTWRFVREDEDFLEAVDAVFDRHTVPAEDLHPRFREGRGGDTSILRLMPRKRPP